MSRGLLLPDSSCRKSTAICILHHRNNENRMRMFAGFGCQMGSIFDRRHPNRRRTKQMDLPYCVCVVGEGLPDRV